MSLPHHKLIQITAPHFCAGLVLVSDIVMLAAPIVKYMQGWTLLRVQAYCAQKRWKEEIILPKIPKNHADGVQVKKTKTGYRWTTWGSGNKTGNGGQAYSREIDMEETMEQVGLALLAYTKMRKKERSKYDAK